jgi:hypothetical protein
MACLAGLFFVGDWFDLEWVGSEWPGKPPFEPPPLDAWTFLHGLIVACWLAGAIGLFYRKKLALIASLVGLGACVMFSTTVLWNVSWVVAFPSAELKRVDGSGVGRAFLIVLFATPLVISLSLFVKLMRSRDQLSGNA